MKHCLLCARECVCTPFSGNARRERNAYIFSSPSIISVRSRTSRTSKQRTELKRNGATAEERGKHYFTFHLCNLVYARARMDSIETFRRNSSVCGHEHWTFSLQSFRSIARNRESWIKLSNAGDTTTIKWFFVCAFRSFSTFPMHCMHGIMHGLWIKLFVARRTLRVCSNWHSQCIHSAVHIETNDQ